jgi:4'-phosphopantetheinyl transferase EntD
VLPASAKAVESRVDLAPAYPFAEEADLVVGMIDSRRREFLTARRCAHEALLALGREPTPILRDRDRAPVWPSGVTGSITHCSGYRAAAAAEARQVHALGIDAEPHRELAPGVRDLVLGRGERPRVAELEQTEPAVSWATVTFCAKEAFYKAWFPSGRHWLDFQDVEIRFEPGDRSFVARVITNHAAGVCMTGRYVTAADLVIAAVTGTAPATSADDQHGGDT